MPVPSHGHAVRDAGWPPAGSEDSEPGSPLGCTAVQPVPRMASVYWHNAFCPNPSLARRAPAGQARPSPEASERGRAWARSGRRCPVSKENLRRLICEGRVCRASVCKVRGPYQRQCQYQTRHRKPGRIITDARQELPAARCPPPPSPVAPSFGVLSREPKRCERGRVGGS